MDFLTVADRHGSFCRRCSRKGAFLRAQITVVEVAQLPFQQCCERSLESRNAEYKSQKIDNVIYLNHGCRPGLLDEEYLPRLIAEVPWIPQMSRSARCDDLDRPSQNRS